MGKPNINTAASSLESIGKVAAATVLSDYPPSPLPPLSPPSASSEGSGGSDSDMDSIDKEEELTGNEGDGREHDHFALIVAKNRCVYCSTVYLQQFIIPSLERETCLAGS